MNEQNLYLDINSTAPYSPRVQDYIKNEFLTEFANASSEHDAGYILSGKIKLHRKTIADHLGCSTKKLIFTSGGTESINTVLNLDNVRAFGIKTVISSAMEHHATLHQLDYLKENGISVYFVRNNSDGILDLDHLKSLVLDYKHSLISLLLVNNETGVINDGASIVKIAQEASCLVHFDAVQALGKMSIDLEALDCDFASFSGHKIGSFKGIGLLYAKDIDRLKPLLHGGGQERGYRPGTYNYPAIKSLALAVSDIDLTKLNQIEDFRNLFEAEILKLNKKFSINCQKAPRVACTSNINLAELDAREVLLKLSRLGVYVSTGSACNGSSQEPSHVIRAMRNCDHIDSLRVSGLFSQEIIQEFILKFKRTLT